MHIFFILSTLTLSLSQISHLDKLFNNKSEKENQLADKISSKCENVDFFLDETVSQKEFQQHQSQYHINDYIDYLVELNVLPIIIKALAKFSNYHFNILSLFVALISTLSTMLLVIYS